MALSVRGLGSSGWLAPYTIADWIDDVLSVAHALADAPLVVAGHSFGAVLALGAAAREPELFSGAIVLDQLVDVEVFARRLHAIIPLWQHIKQSLVTAAGDSETLNELLADAVPATVRERAVKHWAFQDPEVFAPIVPDLIDEWIGDPSIAQLPGDYRGPVVFIDGDPVNGSIVDPAAAVHNATRYPWAERMQIAGVGHWLEIETNPAILAGAINDSLAR